MKEEASQEADAEEEEEEPQPAPPQGREAEATEGQSWPGISVWPAFTVATESLLLRVQFSCFLGRAGRLRRRGVSRGQAARPDSRPAVSAQDRSEGPRSCRWQKWRPPLFAQGWGEGGSHTQP